MAHHLAWVYVNGAPPGGLLKHMNGVKTDNRIANLRVVTKKEAHAHTAAEPITPENVNDIFCYEGGSIFWRSSLAGKNRVAGALAGYVNDNGYIIVEVGGKAVAAHRIIWAMHHGRMPAGEIDHINGVRHDNRIENLRDVAHQTNTENRRSASATSRTGILGVEPLPSGKYRARIRTGGRAIKLGTFDSPEAAHAAYLEAKRRLHEGCTL